MPHSAQPVGDLCAAAIEHSDNTAANLLLRTVGGPPGLTRLARSIGDPVTRLDRTEPALNTAIPGDMRDTTQPAAMAHDIRALMTADVLAAPSRALLRTWLERCDTGTQRLRAGLQPHWRVGDKTGSGDHGTANDVAIVWPPGRAPLAIASFLTQSTQSDDGRDATHAEVARIVVRHLVHAG